MIGLSEHSWKISWDANEVKRNWAIVFWSNLFRLRDIKSLFLDRKCDMIDELKIEDLKQQFIADVDQCSNLPNAKQQKKLAISTQAQEIHF